MRRRHLTGLMALALVLSVAGIAQAHPRHPVTSNEDINQVLDPDGQHGPLIGHLPPTQHNVDLVGKLRLTNLEGGIADVGYFKGFAYLNAWAPHCPGGGGVHVVDVRDPSNPVKVGFLPAETNAFPGEGIHVMEVNTPFFQGDLLLHNNEPCGSANLGMSMWDVTDPLNPVKIGQFGDTTPSVTGQYNSIHSVQGFTQPGKAFAVQTDNEEILDVNIIDITNPFAPVQARDLALEDFPGALGSFANGDTVFLHDEQFKRIGGHDLLALSYWDAGQIVLNVDDPYNPVFVGDSDYLSPDPEFPQFTQSEGNSHESYWSSNSKFLLSTDEDFSPFRTNFALTTGPNAGSFGAGEFGFMPSIDSLPDGTLNGPTVFGGRGCAVAGPNGDPSAGQNLGDPVPPPASTITAAPGEEKTAVFSRGACFFSQKIALGQDLGYDAVIIGQSHGGTRNGLLPDGFFCGGQGHDFDEQARAICIGHRAMHLMFNTTPIYTGPEGTDIPLGTLGEKYSATTEFDGWGYVNLHDATNPNFPIIDTYAVTESKHPGFAEDFGALSVHEVKTDPRPGINLAYFSYYAAGLRVAEFGANGIREVGRFIDEGGNDFWGVFPIGDEYAGHGYPSSPAIGQGRRPLILASDRDFGLYIFDYTGKKPKKD